ncbi:MAG TPA: ABC transporter substrate-binding protein [Acidothermaceae bacterium]
MVRKKSLAAVCLTVGAMLLAACSSGNSSSDTAIGSSNAGGSSSAASPASGGSSGGGSAATGKLEVFSWWTSGSENAALQELFKATQAANPGIDIVNAAVAGGAGTNAQQVLATRLSAHDIPTTWQTHAGGALGDYVKQGVVADLSDLYKSNGWDKAVPKTLLDSLTYDGKIYAVPTGVHRNSVLWWNKSLMAQAGVNLGDSVSWTQLSDAAKALKAKGITPLCLGDQDVWTAATLLEGMLVGELGAQEFNGLLDGSAKWSDSKVTDVVKHFDEALTWANADHKALDWTGGVAGLANGKCAMNVMGDWAYGELIVKNKKVDGTDFGYSILGDPNTFITVTDVFVVGKGSKNPDAGMAWAKAIMDPKTQTAFSKQKGSSPARTDADTSELGAYQQTAAKTLANGTLVPSLIQGQANIDASIGQAFSDGVTLLEGNHDASKFAASMDAAVAAAS